MLTDLLELHRQTAGINTPTELVVVSNGCDNTAIAALRTLATRNDRMRVYAMKYRVDHVTALVAGLENSIGDWVATLDVGADEPAVVRRLFDCALNQGSEVVLGVPCVGRRPILEFISSRLFHRIFESIHGFSLAEETPSARLLSRAVVNAILRDDSPLVAFETLTARGGYRRSTVSSIQRNLADHAFGDRVRVRWRTLLGVSALPLRLASLLCGAVALGASSYSLFVIAIYLLKKDVVPGGTTVSLMLCVTFMMLALVLWLLCEYMQMLLDPGARRPRYEIVEEFGVGIRSTADILNVETEL